MSTEPVTHPLAGPSDPALDSLDPLDPLDMVMAKLNRAPQDQLQAAVVLEAWAGARAPDSFAVTDRLAAARIRDQATPAPPEIRTRARLSDFAVVFTVVATTVAWMPLLGRHADLDASLAVSIGLPLALALDGAVRIRHLSAGNVRSLRPLAHLVNVGVALVLLGAAVIDPTAAAALAVVVLWGQASIVAVRGWFWSYLGLVTLATFSLWRLDGDPRVLVMAALALLGLTSLAVATDRGQRSLPESALASVSALVIGASSGLMLIADPGVWKLLSPLTTVTVLLVTVTGWVASARLARIWTELPAALSRSVIGPSPARRRGAVRRAITSATLRVLLPTLISLDLYILIDPGRELAVVGGFILFTLAMLAMSLNIATRHWVAAAGIAAAGAVVTLIVPDTVAGLPLACGAAVVVLASSTLAAISFRDSSVAFSTRMMIR